MNKWIRLGIAILVVIAVCFVFMERTPESVNDETSSESPSSIEGSAESAVESAPTSDGAGVDSPCPSPRRSGAGAHRAGLLLTFGDGTSSSICVAFDGETIGGFELLEASGVTLNSQDYGGSLGKAVCRITDGEQSDGCDYPSTSCHCDSPPNSWVLFVPAEGNTSWLVSDRGPSSTMVENGGVQAQLWGNDSQVPPSCFYEDICG